MQKEIVASIPLLDNQGNLTQPGYARKLLPVYDRKMVRGGFARLKEWDYYYIGNDRYGVALTVADNSYMGLDSISFLSFSQTPWSITQSPMRIFPMGKTGLPETSSSGVTHVSGKHYELTFDVRDGQRKLSAHMERFRGDESIDVDITLTSPPEESMVICTPFRKKAHFYYNQKINCMPAKGIVTLGKDTFSFNPEDSFGVLDWGRGVWTYHNTWYWGSASGIANGERFGFNIGYGFGDTSAASENMLFYQGRAHKLSQVLFHIPMKDGKEDYLKPWTFSSDDGRFEMNFMPVHDRASCTDFKLLKSDQHQVFGRFSGKAVLDDGQILDIRNLMGFAEKVENKW
ncbi:MAG: DUF2804 domain-containing protein [Christensenellales bacterium]|nr:DUF2804 domain-containing protein [Christensenellales bacterium]